jgi:hypothetical protein
MTPEELKAQEDLLLKIKAEVTETMKTAGMTAEEIDTKIKALDKTEEVEKLKTELTGLQESLTKIKSEGKDTGKSVKQQIEEAFKAKEEDIKNAEKGSGSVSILKLKADVTPEITTAVVTTTTGGNAVLDYNRGDEQAKVRLRTPRVDPYITIGTSSYSTYVYADVVPTHDDSSSGFATVVAEGNIKKRVAFAIETRTASEAVIAAYEILTKQAWRNVKGMASIAYEYLLKRVMLKRSSHILDTVKAGAVAFDATTWVAAKVDSPNLVDCIIAAANQIANSESWTDDIEYMPNVAFVNYGDYMGLKTLKQTDDAYISALQQLEGMGIAVVPVHKRDVAAGKILVGDFSMVNALVTFPYEVSTGWVNDNFIYNKFCLLGETGIITWLREYDKRAFVYDDIADIKSGIDSGS